MSNLLPVSRNFAAINNFNNLMDNSFGNVWPLSKTMFVQTFNIDVQEQPQAYIIKADLPGIKKDEINIALNDGRLSIEVLQNEENEEKDAHYIYQERRSSSMARTVYLADADNEGAQAELDDGVLKIVIPKKAKERRSNRIDIN